jgi:hypothetical protein
MYYLVIGVIVYSSGHRPPATGYRTCPFLACDFPKNELGAVSDQKS